jgi:hypothetical protein
LELTKKSLFLKKSSTAGCQFDLNGMSPGTPPGASDTPNKKKPITLVKTNHLTLVKKQGDSSKDDSPKMAVEDHDKNLLTGRREPEEYQCFPGRNATPEKGGSNLNSSEVLPKDVSGTSIRGKIPGTSPG